MHAVGKAEVAEPLDVMLWKMAAATVAYLTLLARLGWQLPVMEQAVARQEPYTGEIWCGEAVIGQDGELKAGFELTVGTQG